MPLKYACFISYRHSSLSERSLLKKITDYLYGALSSEIEALTGMGVAIDSDRLKGGHLYNDQLAADLCNSACMIVVFVPTYFDPAHTYCAREYWAMEELEERRLRLLRDRGDRRRGLIIPIVFRGSSRVPDEIKRKRHYYVFDDFLPHYSTAELNRRYAKHIKEIAEYVVQCCETLEMAPEDVCIECEEFTLPSDAHIQPWLERVTAKQPFPWRVGS